MTQRTNTALPQEIKLGTTANDGTGDNLRIGGQKINANFLDVYAAVNGIANYALPIAGVGNNGTLGGVKVDGTTVTINNGVISSAAAYTLPMAGVGATGPLGGVKVDGTTVTINNGVISSTGSGSNYTLPTAGVGATGPLGGVKVDGTTITIANGVISSSVSAYTLPTAGVGATGPLGGVKVDGTTITIANGVISSTGTGLSSRASVSTTTATLNVNSSANATIIGFKGYALVSIQTSAAAWVNVYSSSAAQTADASRTISTDPAPGSGVIAEAITTSGTTQYFSPAVIGYNNDGSISSNVYLKITNTGTSSAAITVTLTMIKLEA